MRWQVLGLVGALGCSSGEPAGPPAGALEVDWVGTDTGKFSAPAVAQWCDTLKLLELSAVHGDTGIALLLYPPDSIAQSDSVAPGDYPVVPPQRADSVRPSAAVALRWFAETSIRGFRGDSGRVTLAATAPGQRAGRFSAHLRSATDASRLTVTGSFTGLTVTPATPDCAGRPPAEPDEAGDEEAGEEESDEPAD